MLTRRALIGGALAMSAVPAQARFPHDLPEGLIFFVGNSFTRQHAIPSLVCRIAAASGMTATCHPHTSNGAHLWDQIGFARHLAEEHSARLQATVVLQDHSTAPLTATARQQSREAMTAFSDRFSRTVLFETWPRQAEHRLYGRSGTPSSPAEMAEQVHQHYAAEAKRLGAAHAPVGRIWQIATDAGLNLYARDRYHANAAGAWLAAMLLARALGIAEPFQTAPPDQVPGEIAQRLAALVAQST